MWSRHEALCGRLERLVGEEAVAVQDDPASLAVLARRKELEELIAQKTKKLKMLRNKLHELDSTLGVMLDSEE